MVDNTDSTKQALKVVCIPSELDGERLDKALTILIGESDAEFQLSRSKIEKLIEDGNVRIDGKKTNLKSHLVKVGSEVTLDLPETIVGAIFPDSGVAFEIIYEDKI